MHDLQIGDEVVSYFDYLDSNHPDQQNIGMIVDKRDMGWAIEIKVIAYFSTHLYSTRWKENWWDCKYWSLVNEVTSNIPEPNDADII